MRRFDLFVLLGALCVVWYTLYSGLQHPVVVNVDWSHAQEITAQEFLNLFRL